MNKSGDVVSYVQKNYDLSPKQYVVIHDDLDMPFGTVRVIENRGSGGHNGVQSIASALGTNEFVRIRIGVAREVEPGRIIKPDVLGKLMKEELEQVPDIALRVGKILELISISGVGPAMTAFN